MFVKPAEISKILAKLKWSQTDFAAYIDRTPGHVSRLCSGDRDSAGPHVVAALLRLCREHGLDELREQIELRIREFYGL